MASHSPSIGEDKRCSTVQLGRQFVERRAFLQSENRNRLDTTWDIGAERYLTYAGADGSSDKRTHTGRVSKTTTNQWCKLRTFEQYNTSNEFARAARHRPRIHSPARFVRARSKLGRFEAAHTCNWIEIGIHSVAEAAFSFCFQRVL